MTKVLQERTLKDIDFIWDDKKQEIIAPAEEPQTLFKFFNKFSR